MSTFATSCTRYVLPRLPPAVDEHPVALCVAGLNRCVLHVSTVDLLFSKVHPLGKRLAPRPEARKSAGQRA